MNVDKLIDVMRENCYTLEMSYDGDDWKMVVYDEDLELVTDRTIKDGALIKPKIAAAALSIVKELS